MMREDEGRKRTLREKSKEINLEVKIHVRQELVGGNE